VAKLLESEEQKLRANKDYRTPARTLRRLSEGYMIYEMPGSKSGDWDHFELRRAAMALSRAPFTAAIERAKNGPLESRYVHLMQQDQQLRRTILRLGRT
jgi:hypothetical protein